MSLRKLRISSDLLLPTDAVTSTIVVYGGKGMGKTNFASVLVEEFAAVGLRFCVIDPMGVWWGLRHDESGKGDGVKVLILGGRHGDMPITPESGAIVADLVVDEDDNVIVDISRRADGSMWSIGERVRFVTDYAKRLYQRQGEKRRPIMQVIDEAARFAPQIVRAGDMDVAKCMGAIAVIVEEGRNVGVGVALVTQRSARLNKDVAELADCMIAFRTLGPNSVRAVLDWLGEHVEKARLKDIASTLRELPRGSALVVSPGWLEFEGIVAMRKRRTFDSSKTPEAGKQLRVSGTGAKLDLEKYRARMAEVVERAEANDPKVLRAKIVELVKERDQLTRAVNTIPVKGATKVVEKIVEKVVDRPVFKDGQIARVEKIVASARAVIEGTTARVQRTIDDVQSTCGAALARVEQAVDELRAVVKLASAPPPPAVTKMETKTEAKRPNAAQRQAWDKIVGPYEHGGARDVKPRAANGEHDLKPAHLRILSAIAWWESLGVAEPDFVGVAFVAKTSVKSSSFENNRSRLRAGGYIDYPAAGRMRLTEVGRGLAPPPQIPTTAEALQDAVLSQVTPAIGRMLRVLIESYPGEVSFEDLADRAGTSAKSSSFENNRSWIKARGLSTYPRAGFVRATEILFPEAS